ncbi:family 20 glycosylhydrolase [Carboxylicivirga marina]|nr:family 20 glycosylhydrolase [Carboxylicivirga marina]
MTKNLLPIISLMVLLFASCTKPVNEYNLVPYPSSLEEKEGTFEINNTTKVLFNGSENTQFVAQFFADFISPASVYKLEVEKTESTELTKGAITFIEDKQIKGAEGSYQLSITPNGVLVKANNPVGLFYGFQTIRQLLPASIESKELSKVSWLLPATEINDTPRFSYRGLHLDVGRHFYPVDFIKKFIDLLALHKMNVFHWHLTEDQGWRLEIKKYPKLTEVAAYRDETRVGHGGSRPEEYDGKRYGGFYTQEEAREVVKYAAERHITVIPEIELPGHAQAALAAYPELGCTGGPYEVAKTWGVFKEVYCAGNEKTFEFLENVLLEVMDIFPSEYIHIGGDECPKARWNECPKCKARMKKEHCEDSHELQSYFISRAEKFLNSHGRQIIGWDEILEGGLAPNATVMSWRGIKGGVEAARQKHNVIMTPNSHVYLDYYQNTPASEPLAIGGFLPISKVYSYNPIPESLSAEEANYIIGVQGNIWTEYMPTSEHVEYMAYPRACAIAEMGWLDYSQRNFDQFSNRLQKHFERLDALNVNYFNKVLSPIASVDKVEFVEPTTLELQNIAIGTEIYYTIDGSKPNQNSSVYVGPITLSEEGIVKAVTINETGETSEVLEIPVVRLQYIEGKAAKGDNKGLSCKMATGKFKSCADVLKADGKNLTVADVLIPEEAPFDHFGLVLEGMVTITEEGLYQFSLGSDDGSQFYMNNELVIDNDGFHGMAYKKANLALKTGTYPVKIVYFEATGGENLKLHVITPDGEKVSSFTEYLSH